MAELSRPSLGRVKTSTDEFKANAEITADGRANVHCQKFRDLPARLSKTIAKSVDQRQSRCTSFKEDPIRNRSSYQTGFEHNCFEIPRINIAILIVGSRGDVQPFIPIAQLLSKPPYSHRVRICTHPVFREFVEENGLEFFSIGGDPANLMAYMVKNPGLIPGIESLRAGDVFKRRAEFSDILEGCWRGCIEAGDGIAAGAGAVPSQQGIEDPNRIFIAEAIIANPPSYAHIHCAEKLGIPLHMVFTMPWSPTHVFPHPLTSLDKHERDPSFANYISYTMMELLAWQGLGDVLNTFRVTTLHLDPVSPLWGHMLLSRLKVPFTYLWSPTLIPKPYDWPPYINIAGFSFLNQASTFEPTAELVSFLEAGPPPIYIGFGSVVVEKPDELTNIIFGAIKRVRVRAIISKGWGGLSGQRTPEGVMFIGNCPHDWLFPYVSCVVHHGGAGTTAIGIAKGKPTVIIPFFGDQPFWGSMIYKSGAGPEPIPFKKLTEESLASSIAKALDAEIQTKVKGMSKDIDAENGAISAAKAFHQAVDIDAMRCCLAPDKVAVWQIKSTNAGLSALATSTLIDEGHLNLSEVKLIRHKDWHINQGAITPVMGTAAVASDIATSTLSLASNYKTSLSRTFRKGTPSAKLGDLPYRRDYPPEWDIFPSQHPVQAALAYPQERIEALSRKMVSKSLYKPVPQKSPKVSESFTSRRGPTLDGAIQRDHGKMHEAAHGTWQFASGIAVTGLKVPVAFFYNLANGFHNAPSFYFHDDTVRKRDEITGLGSGLKVAGKEFVLGVYDGITGIVWHPYSGMRQRSLSSFIAGIGQGLGGLVCNTSAAAFGLPGYTLKGVEREFSKRKDRDLKAKILTARLRQGLLEFQRAGKQEKNAIVKKWTELDGILS